MRIKFKLSENREPVDSLVVVSLFRRSNEVHWIRSTDPYRRLNKCVQIFNVHSFVAIFEEEKNANQNNEQSFNLNQS